MNLSVARHATDVDLAWRQIEALSPQVSYLLDAVASNSAALHDLRRRELTLAQYRCVVDPDAADPDTCDDLDLAAQAATAVFIDATVSAGREAQAPVGRVLRFTATGHNEDAHGGIWLTATWLAIVLRDDTLIRQLVSVPLDTMRDADNGDHDSYLYPWVETLQTFLDHRPVPPELFTAVMDGTDPDTARFTPPDAMLRLVFPPIKLFYYILRHDSEKFAAGLSDALEQHRAYWTAADRADAPDGFLALAPLAMAVLARSVGMTFDVTSPYLPTGLLLGSRPVR